MPKLAGHRLSHSLTSGQKDILKRVSLSHVGGSDVLTRNRRRIETVLNGIRPLLRSDGLDVELVEVRPRGVSVHMTGVSSTWCKGATLNFHTDLEAELRRTIGRLDLRLV